MSDPAFADGRPVPVSDDQSDAGWFEALCHAHAIDESRQQLFQAEFEALCEKYSTSPIAQHEFQEDYQKRFRNGFDNGNALKIVDWHKEDLRVLDAYQGTQGLKCLPGLLHLSRRCFILAHGPAYAHIAGADNPTELARQLGLARMLGTSGKATAHKCFAYFQQTLRLPPLPGQRSAAARENMSEARMDQLILKAKRLNEF